MSQSEPTVAYVHLVGVDPACRGGDRDLYDRFTAAAGAAGRREVQAVTSPVHASSIAFHRRIGFELKPGEAETDGVPFAPGYDGPGEDRVVLRMDLTSDHSDRTPNDVR